MEFEFMKRVSVRLDARRRTLTLGGRSVVLQEKSWQVLSMLVARSPDVVSRAEIIGKVWQGNFRTGEKGLNQAVWAIRAALDEDAREPRFIRTIPRVGYQWVQSRVLVREDGRRKRRLVIATKLTGIAASAVIAVAVTSTTKSNFLAGAAPPTKSTGMVATRAYLVNRDIHVEFASGCLGILKNGSDSEVGTPVLSVDGTQIAVTLREPESCRMVLIDVSSGERQDFGNCPAT